MSRPKNGFASIVKVVVPKLNGCVEFVGSPSRDGYGRMMVDGRVYRAHRVAYAVANGIDHPDTIDGCVLHKCDNRLCCAPGHLYLGNRADNMNDCVERGRNARGSMLPHTRLTSAQRRLIKAKREIGEKGVDIANDFGVSQGLVSRISRS